MHAWEKAADPDAYPEAGEPWQPLKLYYHHGFNRPRILALHQAVLDAGLESPYEEWLEEWKDDPDHDARITTQVPCADYFPIRDQALIAHATQIDPEGRWFAIPMELSQKAWPTEDFELVDSLLPRELPEDDLFAGIRDLAPTYDGRRESVEA
jgi:mycothiol S-conjugate amidase